MSRCAITLPGFAGSCATQECSRHLASKVCANVGRWNCVVMVVLSTQELLLLLRVDCGDNHCDSFFSVSPFICTKVVMHRNPSLFGPIERHLVGGAFVLVQKPAQSMTLRVPK